MEMSRYLVKLNECDEYPDSGLYHIKESDSLEQLIDTVSSPYDVPVYEQIGFIQMKPKFVGFVDKVDEEDNQKSATTLDSKEILYLLRFAPRTHGRFHIVESGYSVCGIWMAGKNSSCLTLASTEVAESETCKNCLKYYDGPPINFGSPLLVGR